MPHTIRVTRPADRRLIAALLAALAAGACAARGGPAAATTAEPAPAAAPTAVAQAARPAPSGPRPTAVIMNASFYGKSANSIEPGDSQTAELATSRMWQIVREANTLTLVDSARVAALAAANQETGRTCITSIACARKVGAAAGARWVVMAKVSKTSNLIWYFSGQVVDVATGAFLMDDEFELKGVRDEMIPLGARSLARRVVRVTERAMVADASPPAAAPAAP